MTEQDGSGPDEFGDQTRELLAVVQDWTRRNFPAPPSGHGGPECQWCPLCQLAAALRGEHPEITERIAEAGAAVANAVRALSESTPPRPGAAPTGRGTPADTTDGAPRAPRSAPSGDRPAPRPRVQRIAIDEPEPPAP